MSNIVHLHAINAKTGVPANSVVCCNSKHACPVPSGGGGGGVEIGGCFALVAGG